MKSFHALQNCHPCRHVVTARFPGILDGLHVSCNTAEGVSAVRAMLGPYADSTPLTPDKCTLHVAFFDGRVDPWLRGAMTNLHDTERTANTQRGPGNVHVLALGGGIAMQWAVEKQYPKRGGQFEQELFVKDTAQRFHLDASARTTGGIVLAADHGAEWLSINEGVSEADNIRRVMHLAFYRSVLNAAPGVWLRGDAVARADTGDTVLVLGPPNSGKTTLVHHTLSCNDRTQIIGQGESIAVSVRGGECHVVGLPVAHSVKVGTVLGTLLPNSTLERLMDPTTALAYLGNNEEQLWAIQKKIDVGVDACYGKGRTRPWGRLAATVILGWSGHKQRAMMREASPSTRDEAFAACMKRHVAVPEVDAPDVMASLRSVPCYEVGGGIRFGPATKFVVRELLGL